MQADRGGPGGDAVVVALLREAMPPSAGEEAWGVLERWAAHLQAVTQTDHLVALVRARSPGARWREARDYGERGPNVGRAVPLL